MVALLILLLLPSDVELVALCLSELVVVVTQQIAGGAELCCPNCPAGSSAAA
jgi:hypothetical protein